MQKMIPVSLYAATDLPHNNAVALWEHFITLTNKEKS